MKSGRFVVYPLPGKTYNYALVSNATTVYRMLRISEQSLTFDDVLLLPAH